MAKKTEKLYNIKFSKVYGKAPRTKRAVKAVSFIKKFMKKHFHVPEENIIISSKLNNLVWSKGIEHIPRKITVKAVNIEGIVKAMLPEEKHEKQKKKKEKKPVEVKKQEKPEKEEEKKKLEEKRQKEKAAEKLSIKRK